MFDDVPGGSQGEAVDRVGTVGRRQLVGFPVESEAPVANPVGERKQYRSAVSSGVCRIAREVWRRVEDLPHRSRQGKLQIEEVEAIRRQYRCGSSRCIIVEGINRPATVISGFNPE